MAAGHDCLATRQASCGKKHLDCEARGNRATIRDLLGAVMNSKRKASELDVVALLSERPEQSLSRGQVGTVVECLDTKTVLVEFSDDQGRAYALAPCPRNELLILHYLPEAA